MTKEPAPFDRITVGLISADIYPLQDETGLEGVKPFDKYLSCHTPNVAVAATGHGWRSVAATGAGDDAFGSYCAHEAEHLGNGSPFIFTD